MFLSLLEPQFLVILGIVLPRCRRSDEGEKALIILCGVVQMCEISTMVAYLKSSLPSPTCPDVTMAG